MSRAVVDRAAAEVFGGGGPATAAAPWRRNAAVLGLGLVAGGGLVLAARHFAEEPPPPRVAVANPRAAASAPRAAASAPLQGASAAAPSALVAVAAPASPPAPPVLLRDEGQAWRELAQAWKLGPAQGEPCESFAREQVHCFSRNLSLALIRQLGRPGIVTLDRQSGSPSYALLTGLTASSATLRAGGTEQNVTLAALAARWSGDFSTLWRAPQGYNPRIGERQGRAVVQWVQAHLPPETGPVEPAEAPQSALGQQIRTFQLAQGLPADGQLGPLTFMQLNRTAGVDEPRLRTEP